MRHWEVDDGTKIDVPISILFNGVSFDLMDIVGLIENNGVGDPGDEVETFGGFWSGESLDEEEK